MIKKNISYIVSLVLLVLLVVVIIIDRSETFDRVINKPNIDTLIVEPPTSSNVDTIIKQMEDVDSIYVKLKEDREKTFAQKEEERLKREEEEKLMQQQSDNPPQPINNGDGDQLGDGGKTKSARPSWRFW